MNETRSAQQQQFLGGPPEVFDEVGREQLAALLEFGLTPESKVLDIGCGCLRGGKWIIPLLNPGGYCGIEPNAEMLQYGLEHILDPEIARLKQPRFDHNDRFDCSVFRAQFTHMIARSVWTHADKTQIGLMLDGVARCGSPEVVMLASFRPAKWYKKNDYKGTGWVGRSHESDQSGMVCHRFSWIASACRGRGLAASRVDRPVVNGQPWIAVRRG
jgi:hypothetical protein